MRKILGFVGAVALLATSACRSGAPPASSASTSTPSMGAIPSDAGGNSSTDAVQRFLTAARTNDPRTMGLLFGTSQGPVAARDPQADVEKRMRALACYLNHDRARVLDDLPGTGSERSVTVELTQRELVRRTRFTATPGPRGRWYVRNLDLDAISDFCRPTGGR